MVLPTKVHGVTSQMTIFTQNINRDTWTRGDKDKRGEAIETRTLEPLAQLVSRANKQTNAKHTKISFEYQR
jgi:hypothetical protein